MSTRITDSRIRRYKEAYYNLHGNYPTVQKRGAWLYINNLSPIRSHKLNGMISRLNEMASRLEPEMQDNNIHDDIKYSNETRTWFVKSEEKPIRIDDKWENYIGQDLIESFLYKMLENCGNSVYEMEKSLKSYIFTGIFDKETLQELDKIKRDSVNLLKRRESGYNRIIERKNRMISNLHEKIKELRRNSILFTMDDIQELEYSKDN